jgi:hypothetical protein
MWRSPTEYVVGVGRERLVGEEQVWIRESEGRLLDGVRMMAELARPV